MRGWPETPMDKDVEKTAQNLLNLLEALKTAGIILKHPVDEKHLSLKPQPPK